MRKGGGGGEIMEGGRERGEWNMIQVIHIDRLRNPKLSSRTIDDHFDHRVNEIAVSDRRVERQHALVRLEHER